MNWITIIGILIYFLIGNCFCWWFVKKYERKIFDYLDLDDFNEVMCLRAVLIMLWVPFLAIVGIAALMNGLNELCFKLENRKCGRGKNP